MAKITTNTPNGNITITPNGNGEVDISKVDIDGGTIDGTTIATSDITVGSGKTLNVSAGTLTLANDQISGDKVDGGTISNFASTGIDDNASSTVLTIDADGAIAIDVSSTSDALRVTQRGTGNALVVEDQGNPDSTPFVVDSSGRVAVGHTAVVAGASSLTPQVQVVSKGVSGSSLSLNHFNSTDSSQAVFQFNKSGNDTLGSHTIVANAEALGQMQFSGSDGTGFIRAASIGCYVDGTAGTNDMPGRLVFSTTADNESSPTERVRIDSSGHVIVPNGVTLGTAAGTYNAANTLDDYEEGTFDVTVTMGTSGTCTMNSNYNKMKYTKIGRMVAIQGQVQVSSVASPVGEMQMSLPFAIEATDEGSNLSGCVPRLYNVAKPANGLYPYVFIQNSNAFMSMEWVTDNGATINHVPAAGDYFLINFSYFTS